MQVDRHANEKNHEAQKETRISDPGLWVEGHPSKVGRLQVAVVCTKEQCAQEHEEWSRLAPAQVEGEDKRAA